VADNGAAPQQRGQADVSRFELHARPSDGPARCNPTVQFTGGARRVVSSRVAARVVRQPGQDATLRNYMRVRSPATTTSTPRMGYSFRE
jgi:hypothetical protein